MLFEIAAYWVAAASPSVALQCTLPDTNGVPRRWDISLNETLGMADVVVEGGQVRRVEAAFLRDSVRFYMGSMRVDVSRIDLTISRYSKGEDLPPQKYSCEQPAVGARKI